MELLAGARDETHAIALERLLATAITVPTKPSHYQQAAAIYRACRRGGTTPRQMIDCLIAAIALDADVPVLHSDRDFDTLARYCGLRLA